MYKKRLLALGILCCCFISLEGIAQTAAFDKPSEYDISRQRLVLRLSQGYYTARQETQANVDTNLIYCAHYLRLSRLPMIAEGIDVRGFDGGLSWIDQRAPGIGLQELARSNGRKRLTLLVLLGAYYAFEPGNFDRYKDSV